MKNKPKRVHTFVSDNSVYSMSIATLSRTLNNHADIIEELQKTILEQQKIIEQLSGGVRKWIYILIQAM